MAEERLIDEDKDKKYRIRKNENGEDELVLLDGAEEIDEVPEYDVVTDDEEDLSEEAEKAYEEWEENRRIEVESLKSSAREKMISGDFEGAQEDIDKASLLTEYDGELYMLMLKAHSKDLTDFSDIKKCVEAADGVSEYCDEAQKNQLEGLSAPLKEQLDQTKAQCEQLKKENEDGKASRRATFARGKKSALIAFCCTALPFLTLFILDMIFVSKIFADKNGLYIVLSIVFAGVAVVALIASLFTLNRLIAADRKVRLNENDSCTKIGREFLACNEELDNLNKIYSSFKNDIS